jgi:hypothetical protein
VLASPGRRVGPLALFLIAAASKEILAVDVALGLLAWAWLERRRSRAFACALVCVSAALLGGFACFEHLPHPADKNYFDRYYSYLGHGLGEFARSLLLSPWRVVREIGAGALLRYVLTVLGPWLFLPVVALWRARREAAWLVLVLPSLASAALSTDASLRGADFHYVLELWPALAALTIVVLPRLRGARAWTILWAGLALLAWDHDPWGDLRAYAHGAVDAAPVRGRMSEVPPEASVSGDELSGTWLAGRERVTRWSQLAPFGGHCPEWLVLRASELDDARRTCGAVAVSTRVVGDWVFVQTRIL